jgi:hypothetical protein
LESFGKVVVMASFEISSWHLPREEERNTKKFSVKILSALVEI